MQKNLPLLLVGFYTQLPAPCTLTYFNGTEYETKAPIPDNLNFKRREILPPTDPNKPQYKSKLKFYVELTNQVDPDFRRRDIILVYDGDDKFSVVVNNNEVEQTRKYPVFNPQQMSVLIAFGYGDPGLCFPYIFKNRNGSVEICGYLLPTTISIPGEKQYNIYRRLTRSAKAEWQNTNPLLYDAMKAQYAVRAWENCYKPIYVEEVQEIIERNQDKAYAEIIQIIQDEYDNDTIGLDKLSFKILSIQINEHKIPFGIEFLCMTRHMSDEDKEQLLVDTANELLTNHFAARIHSPDDLKREVRELFAGKIPA
jgi:hypothetical protein